MSSNYTDFARQGPFSVGSAIADHTVKRVRNSETHGENGPQ